MKKGKCKNIHCSAVSNSAWYDLNKNCTVSILYDMCHNPKCNCQKQILITPKQFHLEGAGFKITMKKLFKGSQRTWINFFKLAVIVAVPFVGMAVSAKTKNPKVGRATTNILKSISGGKPLN